MFTLSVTFLMYLTSGYYYIDYIVSSATKIVIGADIALFRSNNFGHAIAINES